MKLRMSRIFIENLINEPIETRPISSIKEGIIRSLPSSWNLECIEAAAGNLVDSHSLGSSTVEIPQGTSPLSYPYRHEGKDNTCHS